MPLGSLLSLDCHRIFSTLLKVTEFLLCLLRSHIVDVLSRFIAGIVEVHPWFIMPTVYVPPRFVTVVVEALPKYFTVVARSFAEISRSRIGSASPWFAMVTAGVF